MSVPKPSDTCGRAARLGRRALLKSAATAGLLAALPRGAWGQTATTALGRNAGAFHAAVRRYLESLRRPDGGFGWEDQPRSHLTPTFAAIGCYHALGQPVPDPAQAAEFVRTHHPFRIKKLERELHVFEYQQVQSLRWLGEDASDFAPVVRTWTKPLAYPTAYEHHGYPVLQQELAAFFCRELLGLGADGLSPQFIQYLDERRRDNGSFNNTPAKDGGDGHVMNTWWGLWALRLLGRDQERKEATVQWVRQCQLPSGGFTYQPQPRIGAVDDAAYTWAALKVLRQLGAQPADPAACVRYLHSLWCEGGGFSDRPGWPPNPLATHYVLEAIQALGALDAAPPPARRAAASEPLPDDLKVFTIQIEAPGQGSPKDAVELARGLRIHLWGAKNAKPGWVEQAQAVADARGVPVRFFVANEEYGTLVDLPGLGTYSHVSDLLAPPGADFGPSLAGATAWTWPQFREQRVGRLEKANGRLFWQFGENQEYVRALLDESVERGGYAAISTFHFGNPDFLNSESFLHRYRHVLPFIALQDAHGGEAWWWSDQLTGFRTVFLARQPTWEAFLEALKRDWIVAVRRDGVSRQELWMHGGARGVQERVRRLAGQWQWWTAGAEIARPMLCLAVVRPADSFDAGRPDRGLTLRVRCAWENTGQGLPKKPLAELEQLTLDGKRLDTAAVQRRNAQGALTDHYHAVTLEALPSGRHQAAATVRVLDQETRYSQTVEFTAP